jgi:hypothetical protein
MSKNNGSKKNNGSAKGIVDLPASKRSQLGLDDVESLDALEEAIRATHAMSSYLKNTKATGSHKSSLSMIKSRSLNQNVKYHNIIKECVDIYYTTPVVRNIIDLMVDFASEGLKIEHKVESQQRFYDEWARRAGFYELIPQIFHSILLTGNCFVMKRTGKISASVQREMTKGSLEFPNVKNRVVPISYTILNPTRIEIDQSELFDERIIQFRLSDADVKKIRKPSSKNQRDVLKSMSPDVRAAALKTGVVILEDNKVTPLFYKKLPWQSWSYPLIFSCIDDINFKKMLRQMDESSAADVIKAIVIFKLGNTKENFGATQAMFSKFATLLKNPAEAKNIVWNDLIDVMDSYPPIDKILGSEKYDVVDRDILTNFGVSEVLVSGRAGNYSSAFLSVRTLQEKLETIRTYVMNNFVIPELMQIQQAVNFRTKPKARFTSMSLRDEQSEKKLLMGLLDRKIISAQTMHETLGLSTDIEKIRISKEAGDAKLNFLGPFNPVGTEPHSAPVGRPSETTDIKQETERKTKPKGLGLGADFLRRIHRWTRGRWCEKNGTSMDAEAQKQINILAAMAFGGIAYTENLNDIVVEDAIFRVEDSMKKGKVPHMNKICASIRGDMSVDCLYEAICNAKVGG